MTNIFVNDVKMDILGVSGTMSYTTRPTGSEKGLWYKQEWKSDFRRVKIWGRMSYFRAVIRFDDNCGNGHNTFSIIAEVGKNGESGGCMHDEIRKYFPELAHLCDWHLVSSDGPMHYVSNVMYYLSDKDHFGKRKGEPNAYDTVVYFGDVGVPFKIKPNLYTFLDVNRSEQFEVVEVPHNKDEFSPQYTISGYHETSWGSAPFNDKFTAERFVAALNSGEWVLGQIPVRFSEGKEPDLKAARGVAIWPDMPDDIVNRDESEIKQILEERLPSLIERFNQDIINAGFYLTPADYKEPNE